MQDFIYKVGDKEYPVRIINKRIKNIHYRFIDGSFVISCSAFTPKYVIVKGLDKFGASLIKRSVKENPAEGEDYIYLYGVKVPIKESGEINFSNGEKIVYKSKNDLKKKIKEQFLKIITNRTKYYANLMDLPLYSVKVRDMKTRYGSNSRQSKTIHYSLILVHYSFEIIDSVIIHELAHIMVPNHSEAFYNVVYKYCPKYKELKRKLNRGEFQ